MVVSLVFLFGPKAFFKTPSSSAESRHFRDFWGLPSAFQGPIPAETKLHFHRKRFGLRWLCVPRQVQAMQLRPARQSLPWIILSFFLPVPLSSQTLPWGFLFVVVIVSLIFSLFYCHGLSHYLSLLLLFSLFLSLSLSLSVFFIFCILFRHCLSLTLYLSLALPHLQSLLPSISISLSVSSALSLSLSLSLTRFKFIVLSVFLYLPHFCLPNNLHFKIKLSSLWFFSDWISGE